MTTMAWAEMKPGHWQRPIGENEAMIRMIGKGGQKFGKDVWSIFVTANFMIDTQEAASANTLTQALRNGWKLLRFHHPSIASIASEETIDYDVPDPTNLERWAEETFIVLRDDTNPQEVIVGLTPRRFATLYLLEEQSSVVLNLSHWRTDGVGACHLLNAYFHLVLDSLQNDTLALPWGEEAARLMPGVEEALNNPATPSSDTERAAKQYLDTLAHNTGAIGCPYKSDDGIIPGGTQSVHLQISEDTTQELNTGCSRLGVRLEAAIHAAVAATAYSIANPPARKKHFSSTMRHSLRPHLLPPYDGEAGAAGLFTAGYVVKVPASHTWLENAKYYEAEYSMGATSDLLSSRRQYAVVMKGILGNKPILDTPPSGLDISCIPHADTLVQAFHTNAIGSLEVRSFGIGVEVLSRHLYIFVWTFKGQLELRLVYNEAFHDQDRANRVLETVKKELVSNLILSQH